MIRSINKLGETETYIKIIKAIYETQSQHHPECKQILKHFLSGKEQSKGFVLSLFIQ